MSTTPAAQLARLRTSFQEWAITRSRPEDPLTLRAVHVSTGERITAHSLAELEHLLSYPGRRTAGQGGQPDKEGK